VFSVRWPVLDGVNGEGLLYQPKGTAIAHVISLGAPAEDLAANGIEVIEPVLVDLGSQWSGHPDIGITKQTHREWIYRQAFHMGRHIIGYEVQKVLACVDWFRRSGASGRVGVAGSGEGGLLAFYAAAMDTRIDAALVTGYLERREKPWEEPLYRNVWGLLREFGDEQIASLIAPRGLTRDVPAFAAQLGVHEWKANELPINRRRTSDRGAQQQRTVMELERHVQG
jgi:hypothetical protein